MQEVIDLISDDDSEDRNIQSPSKTEFDASFDKDIGAEIDVKESSSRSPSPTLKFFQSDLFREDGGEKRKDLKENQKDSICKSKKQKTTKRQSTLSWDSRALYLARDLRDSVDFTSGSGQCDTNGMGVVAKIDIKRGKKFVDDIAKYEHGPVPKEWHGDIRGNYIKTDNGYIILRPSHSEWMNEARCKWHKETGSASEKCEACKRVQNVSWRLENIQSKRMLTWHITKDINKGEELLAFYI